MQMVDWVVTGAYESHTIQTVILRLPSAMIRDFVSWGYLRDHLSRFEYIIRGRIILYMQYWYYLFHLTRDSVRT